MNKLLCLILLFFSALPLTVNAFNLPLACKINTEIPSLSGGGANLNPHVLKLAMKAYSCAIKAGYKDPRQIMSIIDYTLPSNQKRLWVIDLRTGHVIFNTLVAQGKFTGGLFAKYFSDRPESKESSIGLFVTDGTYVGHDGYSLRINGLDKGFNDKALEREIVIHGAWYVSDSFARRNGRIGLSWGCPAVPKEVVTPLINTVKDGTLLFSYYPEPAWLANSKFLHCD